MRLFQLSLAAVVAAVVSTSALGAGETPRISTIAGTGAAAFGGDRPSAAAAALNHPRGLAVTADGSFLIAEAFGNTVSRVYRDGTIATVAGVGFAGYGGDGGPATSARLDEPHAVVALPDGGFLVADALNHRIRRVSATGVITTVAGTGVAGASGDGGPASSAELRAPHCVALQPDGGFLIADTDNHLIRRVAPDGTITTVAGTGEPGFGGDGGPATAASLRRPFGVSPTADGGFLIADTGNHRIRRVAPDGTISTVAGTGEPGYSGDGGPAVSAQIFTPHNAVALPDGGFVIADTDNNRIRRVAPDGTITTLAGNGVAGFSGDGGDPIAAELNQPKAVVPFGNGFLIADAENQRVRLVSAGEGGAVVITTVAGTGVASDHGERGLAATAALNRPFGVAALANGGVLVADTFNNRIRRIFPDGTITTVAGTGVAGHGGDGGRALSAQLRRPSGVAATAGGGFLIADALNNRIRRVSPAGTITTVAGTGARGFGGDGGAATRALLSMPRGVATLPGGAFLIADTDNNRIRRVSRNGRITTVAGTGSPAFAGDGGQALRARLQSPFAVTPVRGGGFLIADTGNRRIRRVLPNGKITTVAGGRESDRLAAPFSVASLRSGGFLVVDGTANVVRRVVGSGPVATVAGDGRQGYGGDGGPAASARLNFPVGVAVLSDGSFVIADAGNNRIRLVSRQG